MSFKESVVNLVLKATDLMSPATESAAEGISELESESRDLQKSLTELTKTERNISNFKRLSEESETLSSAWQKSEQAAKKLKAALEASGQPAGELAQRLAAAEKAASKSKSAFDRNQQSLAKLKVTLKATGVDQKNMGSEQQKLFKSSDQLRQKLAKVNNQLNAQKKALNSTGAALKKSAATTGTLTTSLNGAAKSIAAFAGSYLTLRGLSTALKGILSTGSQFEKFEAQLTQVMGSIAAGEQATEWIKEFTRQTPYSISQVTESFVKLKSFGLDPMDGTYEALASQAAALGGTQETLNGVILATGQAWAKGKLQGEEILQMVERGVPVWDLLAKATGKSTAELQELSSAGRLGREEISLLVAEMGRASSGALEGQMSTLSGLMSNLGDAWTQFVALIADSGIQDYVKSQLQTLIDKFTELKENGKLQEWAQAISDAFVRLGAAFKNFFAGSSGDIESFGNKVAEMATSTGRLLQGIGAGFGLFINGLKGAFNGAVVLVAGYIETLTGMWGALFDSIGFDSLAESFKNVSASMSRVADEYSAKLRENNASIKDNFKSLTDSIIAETKTAATNAADNLNQIPELTGAALKQAVDDAAKETARMETDLARLKQAAADAVIATENAWVGYYDKTGQAQAEQLARINAAVKTEGDARRAAAAVALQLNNQIAASQENITKLAAETTKAQAAAANKAREALAKLGVDVGLAFKGISSGADTAIKSLDAVVKNIKTIGGTSKEQGAAFSLAFEKALESISTAEEFEAIEAKVRALFAEDQIDSAALTAALADIQEKTQEITDTPLGKPAKKLADELTNASTAADALKEKLAKQKEEQEKLEKHLDQRGGVFSRMIAGLSAGVLALGEKAAAAFRSLQFGTPEVLQGLDLYNQKLAAAEQRVGELATALAHAGGSTLRNYFTELALNAATVEKNFWQQKIALDSLTRSIESGRFNLRQLEGAAGRAAGQFDVLDDADLDQLHSAIDAAKNKLDTLNDSAESTLSNLRERLAELRGDTAEAEQIRQSEEIKALEAQLAAAEASGAKEAVKKYQDSLAALRKIHGLENAQIKERELERQKQAEADKQREAAEAKAQRQREQEASTTTNKQDSTAGGAGRGFDTVIQLQLDGKKVNVGTDNPADLLNVLEQAGLRST